MLSRGSNDRIGAAGAPAGAPRIAAHEGESGMIGRLGIAAVTHPAGPLTDHGCRPHRQAPNVTGIEREDWTLDDRGAKVLIGILFAFEVAILVVTLLWL